MNLKEDKEQVINMLTSEDKEIRSLVVNSIRNNYDTDFKYVYSYSVDDGNRLKIPKNNNEDYFDMDVFLECTIYSRSRKNTIREMLDLIIEYNELKRRQG